MLSSECLRRPTPHMPTCRPKLANAIFFASHGDQTPIGRKTFTFIDWCLRHTHQRHYIMETYFYYTLLETETLPSVKNRTLGKDLLCRVLHSAKNYTRQRFLCRAPGTRQTQALGKGLLCRAPNSRQNLYTRHRLPVKRRRATSFFAERLRLGTRQRFFF